jgi:hypothetical protein
MAETTKIEWADATVSMWWGCTRVSEVMSWQTLRERAQGVIEAVMRIARVTA